MSACSAIPASEPSSSPLRAGDADAWASLLAQTVSKEHLRGTHRCVAPAITLNRVRRHFASLGITRVANITGLDRVGIPVVMVCRPNSRSLSTSLGKGIDLDCATVSGVMECIELHHAERIEAPLRFASAAEMQRRCDLVDTRRLPRIKNSRYHPNFPLLWIEGCDLISLRSVWVPFEAVHASAAIPQPGGSGCFASTSNGLASGNHLLEAIVHALFELIERDAVSLWGALPRSRKDQTAIDLSSVEDPTCRSVIRTCADASLHLAVFDCTSDLRIPAFLCELREHHDSGPVFSGMGCHLDSAVAFTRAVTEAVQSRLTLIAGSRDDLSRRDYSHEGYPGPKYTPKSFSSVSSIRPGATLNADFRTIVELLTNAGIGQVIAVDLTLPEYGIPVVRVLAPGLEGPDDDPEYTPGPRARAILADAK